MVYNTTPVEIDQCFSRIWFLCCVHFSKEVLVRGVNCKKIGHVKPECKVAWFCVFSKEMLLRGMNWKKIGHVKLECRVAWFCVFSEEMLLKENWSWWSCFFSSHDYGFVRSWLYSHISLLMSHCDFAIYFCVNFKIRV